MIVKGLRGRPEGVLMKNWKKGGRGAEGSEGSQQVESCLPWHVSMLCQRLGCDRSWEAVGLKQAL